MQLQLPEPSADALRACGALQDLIADEIRRQGGWISFARYMELALYAPGLGYYSGGAAKLGKDGDFTTAPEITPLFGQTLAHVVAELMQQSAPHILEFGAGTGRLAHDILSELREIGVDASYSIVDLSGELRARQQEMLSGFANVVWLDRMPEAFSGVVLGNEVLDAMPVHLVLKTGQGWRERGIVLAQQGEGVFAYAEHECSPELLAQIPDAEHLPDGYLTEVHPVAEGFMASLAAMLNAGRQHHGAGGAAILIDYGFPRSEYYLAQRNAGTLMCHYRHHAHPDPLYLPGLQDVTAHVDFTAMAYAAAENGLDVLGYTSQARFLLNAGLGELLLRTPPEQATRFLPQANAVQRLTSPAEMGELFKVLAVGCGVELPPALLRGDRSHRL